MKKLTSLLLVFAMLMSLALCFTGCNAEKKPTEGLDFYPLSDGTYGVMEGKTIFMEEIVIPSTYNGKKVSTILDNAFYEMKYLESVVISDGVTNIRDYAFYHCWKLKSVVIPDSVTSIGDRAFNSCDYVFYVGTEEDWEKISVGIDNYFPKVLFYSKTRPTDNQTDYWHYVDGVPEMWYR